MIREKRSTAAGDHWREIGPVSQSFVGTQALASEGAADRLLAASQSGGLAVHDRLELTAGRQDAVLCRHHSLQVPRHIGATGTSSRRNLTRNLRPTKTLGLCRRVAVRMQGAFADTPSSLTKTPMGYTFRRSRWEQVGFRLMLGVVPHSTPTAP